MNFKNLISRFWKIIWPYLIPAIAVIPLFLVKVGGTVIRADMNVDHILFDNQEPINRLFGQPVVSEICLSQFEAISISVFQNDLLYIYDSKHKLIKEVKIYKNSAIKIIPIDPFSQVIVNNCRLNDLLVEPGARLKIKYKKEDTSYVVSINTINSRVHGDIIMDNQKIECYYCKFEGLNTIEFNDYKTMFVKIISSSKSDAKLNISDMDHLFSMVLKMPLSDGLVESDILINKIVFREMDEPMVNKGKIYFKREGKERLIEYKEFVEISNSQQLYIASLMIDWNGINIIVDGHIDDIKIGTKDFLKSQIPSLYAKIISYSELISVLGFIFLIGTTIHTILESWRK